MKKTLMLVIMLIIAGTVFAEGVSEQSVRDGYAKKGGFPNRDAWLYEFNTVAANLVRDSNSVINYKPSTYNYVTLSDCKRTFDDSCVKYKVLLDIGVELKYITDAVRKQQTLKAEEERKKVSQYLASQANGLGLE